MYKKSLPELSRILMRVSLFACLFLTTATLLWAAPGHGQALNTQYVNIHFKKSSLEKALTHFQSTTGIKLAYDQSLLAGYTISALHFENERADHVLESLLNNKPLTYREVNGIVVIQRLEKKADGKKQPGQVAGTVLDETGQPLPGASVRILELNTGIQTDIEGKYSISLASGTYTVEISFVSYETKRVEGVTIAEDKVTVLDVAMKLAANTLNEVVITETFERASVEGLLAKQKNNEAITDGISADQIARTPDKNIAESLKRITGLSIVDNKYVVVRGLSERYTQAVLNGQIMPSTELNRKNFTFDIIPSNLVDNVTVVKTITPDKSAEFGGGLVEVNTKDIPTENSFSLTLGSSYNDKTTGKYFPFAKISNKEYLGAVADDRKIFGSLDWKSRADIYATGKFSEPDADGRRTLQNPSDFANNWKLYNYTPLPSFNGQLSAARAISLSEDKKLGFVGSLSYRNTWQTQDIRMSRGIFFPQGTDELFGFKGNRYGFITNVGGLMGVGYSTRKHLISIQSMLLRTLDRQMILGKESSGNIGGYFDFYTVTNLWQTNVKSQHALGSKGAKVNLGMGYTVLNRMKPDNHQADLQLMTTGSPQDDLQNPDADFSITSPMSENVSGGGAMRAWNRAFEKNLSWNADLSVPVKFSMGDVPISNILKAGYSGWYKDRMFWVMVTGSVGFATGPEPFNEAFDPAGGGTIYTTRFGDDFRRSPTLQAVYAMADHKIADKVRLVWGMRAEYYDLNGVNAFVEAFVKTQKESNNDLTDYSNLYNREPNWNYFPSANLTYSLTPKMNLRLAYSKSIIRPDLREISLFREYDFELGGNYENLSPIISTTISHYDFRYEWYANPGEIISLSAFRKNIRYPMEIFARDNRLFELKNDKDAVNNGIELEIRKSLAFTHTPVLKNLTLSGNITRMWSKVRLMDVTYGSEPGNPYKLTVEENILPAEKRPQAGASNIMFNAGLSYDTRIFSFNMNYSYVSNRFYRAGNLNVGSLYEQPLNPLDAQVSFHVLSNKGLLRLSISNLLNSKYVVYLNRFESNGLELNPKPGTQPSLEELKYKKGVDIIDYEAAPGRTYSVSFTYNF